DRRDMQYLYNDGDLYYFMDQETYEQEPIGKDLIGDNFKFVKEEMICTIRSYQGKPFAVEPPMFVELEVTDCEPGIRGDTATGSNKGATVETGANIRVPFFINTGDKIRIDTRTGEYLERA
ncbi:MAG: elongation factor P, partial [Clostridia bacterium]|nr:elongation factor P [Clostridia bacterium]